jgi:hypothetical protein
MAKELIVSVPFSYTVRHILKGRRSAIEFTVLDEAKAVLLDLTSQEAPTALRFVPKEWRMSKTAADHPWWDGRLWEPWSRVSSGVEDRGMSVDELLKVLEDSRRGGDSYYSPFAVNPSKPYGKEFIALDGLPPGRIEDGGEKEKTDKLATIARRAAEMVLVDGKVYVPAVEPVYKIEHASGWGSERRSEEPVLYLKTIGASEVSARNGPDFYFRVDRLDDALDDLMESENRRRTHYGHRPLSREEVAERCVLNRVEVLMPEAVRFRYDMRPRLDEGVNAAFEALKEELAEADAGYFATYASFRTLCRAVPRDHDSLARALQGGVIDALRGGKREHLADRLENLIQEWINRDDPDSVSEADLSGLSVA